MDKKFIKFIKILSLLALFNVFLIPGMVLAQNKANIVPTGTRCANFYNQFKLSSGANVVASSSLPVYCSGTQIILFVFNTGMALVGTVTIVFLMIGGFFYVTSAGNEEQAEKGRKILINSIIGLVVIILATAIVRIISTLLNTGS